MKYSQEGKGFIPILIIVVVAAIVAVLFISQGNGLNNSASIPPSSGTYSPVAPKQAQGVAALMLDPAQVDSSLNQTFTVNVNIDTKTETVTGVELHLSYNQDYLEAVSTKMGTFLPVVLSPAKIMAGSTTIVVGSQPTSPQKGTGTVQTVTFRAKKAGTAQIMFDKATLVTAVGKNGNILGPTTNATVNIK